MWDKLVLNARSYFFLMKKKEHLNRCKNIFLYLPLHK